MKKLLPLFISAALGGISSSAWADSLAEIYDLAKQNDPQLLSVAAQRDRALKQSPLAVVLYYHKST